MLTLLLILLFKDRLNSLEMCLSTTLSRRMKLLLAVWRRFARLSLRSAQLNQRLRLLNSLEMRQMRKVTSRFRLLEPS